MHESLLPAAAARVAIVDDDPVVVQVQRELLESEGHEVRSAPSIAAGIELVRSFNPDLLLLDYMMPEGTGAEVVRAIREFNELTQVILVSGVTGEQPVRKLLAELDIQGFHYKGDGPSRLLLQVDAVLKHARVLKHLKRQKTLLRYILKVTPEISKLQPLEELFETALGHLCQLASDPTAARPPDGVVVFGTELEALTVRAATGRFCGLESLAQLPVDTNALVQSNLHRVPASREGFVTLPFAQRDGQVGFVILYTPSLPQESLDPVRLYLGQLEQALENTALYNRATIDCLTGVYNRGYAEQQLHTRLELGRELGTETAVVLLDVDHFKSINDDFGHAAGDVALRRIAQAMRRGCRQEDLVARFGGEEFLVILADASLAEATIVAERILETIRRLRVNFDGRDMKLTASAGVAVAGSPAVSFDELLRRADRALYQSKSNGRDRVSRDGEPKARPDLQSA